MPPDPGARFVLAVALASLPVPALADVASWAFIESVGGLRIGEPTKISGGWVLPVQADVSGLTKVTAEPKLFNSGIACWDTRAKVEGPVIALSVITGIAGGNRSSRCPPAKLDSIAPGKYAVRYRGAKGSEAPLGVIVIAP